MPRHACDVHCCRARHAVGRAFHQGFKRECGVQPVAESACAAVIAASIVGPGRALPALSVGGVRGLAGGWCCALVLGLRCRAHVGAGDGFALGNGQLQRDWLAIQAFEQCGDAACVLGTDPVEFETVGHQQGDLGKIFRHLGHQRLDPGVELLLRKVLGQLFHARLPQALSGI